MSLSTKALGHPRSEDEQDLPPSKRMRTDEVEDDDGNDGDDGSAMDDESDDDSAAEDEGQIESTSGEEEDDAEDDRRMLEAARVAKLRRIEDIAAGRIPPPAQPRAAGPFGILFPAAPAPVLVPAPIVVPAPIANAAPVNADAVTIVAPAAPTDHQLDPAVETEILRQAEILVPLLDPSPFNFLPREDPQQAPRMVAKLRQLTAHAQMKQLALGRVIEMYYGKEIDVYKEHNRTLPDDVAKQTFRDEAVRYGAFMMERYQWWSDASCTWLAEWSSSRFSMPQLYSAVRDTIGEAAFEQRGLDKLAKTLQAVRSAVSRAKAKDKKQAESEEHHRGILDALTDASHPRNLAVPGPDQENWYIRPLENLLRSVQPSLLRQHQRAIEHSIRLLGCDGAGLVRTVIAPDPDNDPMDDTAVRDIQCPAQALHFLTDQLRQSAGVERLKSYWSVPENIFYLTSKSQCIVTNDNLRLVELFVEAHSQHLKVVDDRGSFYMFDERTRLWKKHNADALTLALVPWANRITKHEVQLANQALMKTPGSGAFEAAAGRRTGGSSQLDAQGDLMLAEIVKALNSKAKELCRGSSNGILTPWIRTQLRDDAFETTLDCANPDELPISGGMVINMKTWGETRDYELSVRKRQPSDMWSFECPVTFQEPAHRPHRFGNILRWLWPLCGGTKDKLTEVINVYERDRLREFALQVAEQARGAASGLAGLDPSSEQYEGLRQRERAQWQYAQALDMLRSISIHFGMMLTGRTERRFYLHWGSTSKGKSKVWKDIMARILGPLLVCVSADFLAATGQPDDINKHTAGLLALTKARVALMDESERARKLSCRLIKARVQDGTWKELLRACHGREAVETQLNYKLVFLGNHMLTLDGDDPAVLGRLLTYEFQTRFDSQSPDSQAMSALLQQQSFLDECFTYFVENVARWYTVEQQETPECTLSREAKRMLEDLTCPLDSFIREKCVHAKSDARKAAATSRKASAELKHCDLRVPHSKLFEAYRTWVSDAMADEDRTFGTRHVSKLKKEFRDGLQQRGFKSEKLLAPDGNRIEHWVGLRLHEADEEETARPLEHIHVLGVAPMQNIIPPIVSHAVQSVAGVQYEGDVAAAIAAAEASTRI